MDITTTFLNRQLSFGEDSELNRMVEKEETEAVTNGTTAVNGARKAKTLPKSFDTIEDTISAFGILISSLLLTGIPANSLIFTARGELVIVLDSTSRENEGDLIMAAQDCTTSKMAFIIRYTSGYICVPVSHERTSVLGLPQMVQESRDPNRTAYTITVDALTPFLTTGISAADRAATARMLANPEARAEDFRRPGHIVPLRAREGLVRRRFGHTEAGVELCRLAGKEPAAVICEMVVDGEPAANGKPEMVGARMMRRDDCLEFGRRWGIRVCTIEDMVAYVEEREGKLDMPGDDY